MYNKVNVVLGEGRVFRGQAVTISLCCETQRETFNEVTTGFNDKFTASSEPVLLDLTGSNYCFSH